MKIAGILILLMALFAVSQPPAIQVTINSNGVVVVQMDLWADEGLNVIKLPVTPIPESITVSVDNSTLIPIYENGSLYVFSPTSGNLKIDYLANISARDGVFSFEAATGELIRLVLKPEIILLSVPDNLVNFTYVGEDLLIEFYGPEKIEYAVKNISASTLVTSTGSMTTTTTMESPSSAMTSTTTMTTASTPVITMSTEMKSSVSTTTAPIPLSEEEKGAWNQLYILTSLAIMILVIASVVLILRRRGGRPAPSESGLSGIDLEILRLIKDSGGSMMQGDLQAVLRLPKTTLWRHVRKLEKLGYIEIIKEGPFNRLILIRDFE